jgi:hypothetical protein
MLSEEIQDNLRKDSRVRPHKWIDSDITTFTVISCGAYCGISTGKYGWIDFPSTSGSHCFDCIKVLAKSLPSMDTLLQRCTLAGQLTMETYVDSCLFCYRDKGRVQDAYVMCVECTQAHEQKKVDAVKKMMLIGCILGGDIARLLAENM